MNTRCYRCGWSLSLSRETIAAALANANATGTKHHIERCPRCRQTIKIPIDQLKRFAPQDATALDLEPQPAPVASPPTPAAEATQSAEVSQPPSLATSPEVETASPTSEKLKGEQAKSPRAEKTSASKKKTSAKSPASTKTNKPAARKPAAKKKTSSK